MLDGLLGRGGFSSKCKSLIKLTRTRIDVILRKRNATQKFLKKDIADLLADGLENNAFGRAKGLIAEMILTSCYEFIDHVCQIIVKHLSTMQKDRECPEDCREAVASLMFAAARFSDLPELRDLRYIFQERYGSSLECYVNQKLVEHISPMPPDTEKKLKLLEDIASEFSVKWDSYTFEQKMITNAAAREDKPATHTYLHAATENKYLAAQPKETIHKIYNDIPVAKNRIDKNSGHMKGREVLNKEHHALSGAEAIVRSQNADELFYAREFHIDRHKSSFGPKAAHKAEDCAERVESVQTQQKVSFNGRQKVMLEIERHKTASQVRVEPMSAKDEVCAEFTGHIMHDQDTVASLIQKQPGEDTDRLKSDLRGNMPPPYVKPKKSKHKSKHYANEYENDTLTLNPGERNVEPATEDRPHYTAEYYKDDTSGTDPTPRKRSRRRHHKSSSAPGDGDNMEVRVARRVTSRRRNDSKKGLKILFEEDCHHHHPVDEEERMIDKMLLHYSKKPSTGGEPSEKPSRRNKTLSVRARNSLRDGADMNQDLAQPPSRSVSLPREQSSSEYKKVFTRAASFDQEASTPAKHVHPKLPDYDDLAARFAALRRNKA